MALNIQRLNFDPVTGDNPSEAFMKLDLDIGEIAEAIDGDGTPGTGFDARLSAVETTVDGLGDAATKDVGTTEGTVAAGDDVRITGSFPKTGGPISGSITVSGTITASSTFASSTANVVLAPASAGTVFLRPNGPASTTGQATVGSTGNLSVSGAVSIGGGLSVSQNGTFTSPSLDVIGTGTGGLGALTINSPTANAFSSTFMAFNRSGAYATYFGLNQNNRFAHGGWSQGANAYEFWTGLNTTVDSNNFIKKA